MGVVVGRSGGKWDAAPPVCCPANFEISLLPVVQSLPPPEGGFDKASFRSKAMEKTLKNGNLTLFFNISTDTSAHIHSPPMNAHTHTLPL